MPRYKLFNGTVGEYRALHNWVERKLGKPRLCSDCGTTVAKRFEWANVSGEYRKDLSDWKRLCVACHKKASNLKKTHCFRGHELTLENCYITPSTGDRHCRECKRYLLNAWRRTKRLELL